MNYRLYEKMKTVNVDFIRYAFENMGYKFFEKGQYNLNIFGVRANERKSNYFDDVLAQVFKDDKDKWVIDLFRATTDPGKATLKDPSLYGTKMGTAIYVPGQYRGVYKIGMHRNKYKALRLDGNIKVYRDNNRDDILDFDPSTIEEGNPYCNIHHAGEDSQVVETWSAGCQVIKSMKEWNRFMANVYKCADTWSGRDKERFTYTLFTETEFFCK